MWYVVNPKAISLDDYAEVGIWCSMPAALTSRGVPHGRYPRLHVHLRDEIDGPKILDHDFDALTLTFDPARGLFGATLIDRVHVTPPVAKEFVLALERGDALTCFNCVSCGSPHLDLGEFVRSKRLAMAVVDGRKNLYQSDVHHFRSGGHHFVRTDTEAWQP